MAEILGIFYHLRQKKKSQLLQALCAAVFMWNKERGIETSCFLTGLSE
jgi:hypothetical protein